MKTRFVLAAATFVTGALFSVLTGDILAEENNADGNRVPSRGPAEWKYDPVEYRYYDPVEYRNHYVYYYATDYVDAAMRPAPTATKVNAAGDKKPAPVGFIVDQAADYKVVFVESAEPCPETSIIIR